LDLARLSGELLEVLTRQGRHQQLLDRAMRMVRVLLRRQATRALLAGLIGKNLNSMLRALNFKNVIGHYVARKFVVGVAKFLKEVDADDAHPLRARFDDVVRNVISKLKTDPDYRLKAEQIRDQILASP